MDRQRIEGTLKKTTGKIKEKAGQALGDRHLENEGIAENTEGHIRSGVGKAMDAVRDVVNKEKIASHEKAGSEGDDPTRLARATYCPLLRAPSGGKGRARMINLPSPELPSI